MSINMNANFLKLLTHFRRHDLTNFKSEHDTLYEKALETGDHLEVTSHYYSVMSTVIDEYFGGNFHFVPPKFEGQKLEEALKSLHCHIAEKLELSENVHCLDIGCGIGGVMLDIADFGAKLTGVTIAPNEAEIGNEKFANMGISDRCKIVAADCQKMPFEDSTFDVAYAIYSLKYIPNLDKVMKEIQRVLKPGGKFIVYDLIKTNDYDKDNKEHYKTLHHLEYACGMPSLHTQSEVEAAAEKWEMPVVERENLEETYGNRAFHYCFSASPMFMWLVSSPVIDHTIRMAEILRILPAGFKQFNRTFLCGTVNSIVGGGRMGILSGADILLFEKKKI
ncbi:Sterol 4-C-methyltransferase strm-1 [Caenorhabditis elegans]|uniref:Sterol 4-C-methyltransferase strm-1 n=1 Tax=Caenorhabditis elegans TaxID=6239 RepID=STRM1_CAEEL|nr:Sterol 4-C-methyltransferase strm-1 [Caenorhabditis elegans]Q9TYP1.2 RecName: Full=Sterol 4-C-methyltransferase strm-1; Short=STRM-1; AltName: Full=Sterol A-ring methylase-1 [Caenorhabditis elegans]CCD72180.1 Sterol 4-C-methyltransferase strm-1 [Caenorhabditis elegans]|eukprot:NP_497549.2 Sterol 4-C-methyltransferase strm-1 [Caenorhabditis elegans]